MDHNAVFIVIRFFVQYTVSVTSLIKGKRGAFLWFFTRTRLAVWSVITER